jgi:hypothetical protein
LQIGVCLADVSGQVWEGYRAEPVRLRPRLLHRLDELSDSLVLLTVVDGAAIASDRLAGRKKDRRRRLRRLGSAMMC